MRRFSTRTAGIAALMLLGGFSIATEIAAEPNRYPQFSQLQLPRDVKPEFIRLDQLVDEIIREKNPVIIDVRTQEEYDQLHIKGSRSVPLNEIPRRLPEIPKEEAIVLY